jgi:hypothetical protein
MEANQGELTPELAETLDALHLAEKTKVDGLVFYLKALQGEADALAKLGDEIYAKRQAKLAKKESLMRFVRWYMEQRQAEKLAGEVFRFQLCKSGKPYQGAPAKAVPKIAIVYQIDEVNPETGKRYEVSVEKTLAFGPTAGLRKWLGNWRGKQYSDDEARNVGAPIHKLVGVNCLLTVEHKTSGKGRVYAIASNISPKPKAMTGNLAALDYTRGDYWEKRKEEYAASVAAHRAVQGNGGGEYDHVPPHDDAHDDDDLPF